MPRTQGSVQAVANNLQPLMKYRFDAGGQSLSIAPEAGRGGLILTLGILSIVLLGFFLGIPAWVMGNRDLKKIRTEPWMENKRD